MLSAEEPNPSSNDQDPATAKQLPVSFVMVVVTLIHDHFGKKQDRALLLSTWDPGAGICVFSAAKSHCSNRVPYSVYS